MTGRYNRHGVYIPFLAWEDNSEPNDDWTQYDPEYIEFPEPGDHDRRFDDYLSTREGDIGDDSLPPY